MHRNLRSLMWMLTLIAPGMAMAHTSGTAVSGWSDGFNHPIHGWDHLLAMIAVGLLAARHRGRVAWALPLAFVSVMALGGLVGASGFALPGVEFVIALSVLVLGALAFGRAAMPLRIALPLIGAFAFFHGFAHGTEMPGSGTYVSFGFGFLVATSLLHVLGIVTGRAVACLMAMLAGPAALAAEAPVVASVGVGASRTNVQSLDEVLVLGRSDNQMGIADSASEGNVGQRQLELRPIQRPGELLETVPGLIVSQHSGEGKANQYYLRGFNLDHGTDFLTQIEGVPINLVSHGHGQGWTDTGFLIPELVNTIAYQKGVYHTENGDFSSAGAANIHYVDALPSTLAKVEVGSFNYARALLASSRTIGEAKLLYALEGNYNDGPWQHGNHYRKGNGVVRYGRSDGQSGWIVTLMGYKALWNATDQIALRAVEEGPIDRFGALDPSDGGNSQRYSVNAEWRRDDARTSTSLLAYGYYYDLDLYSNFTYLLADPANGDQFEQQDRRWVSGLKFSHAMSHSIGAADSVSTVGLQVRDDRIHNGLFPTEMRSRLGMVREDAIRESSLGVYAMNRTGWTTWLRSAAGVRVDQFRFAVDSNLADNSGERAAALVSPKINLAFGPWRNFELYASAGYGFHSNDARGVNTKVDPVTGSATNAEGEPVRPAQPLVRTKGAELGLRTDRVAGLQTTVTAWLLDLDSELVFTGDAGTTEASRPSRRYGIEIANYFSPAQWLTLDADLSFSHARFTESAPEGDYVPGSVESVVAAGIELRHPSGLSAGLRLRYFGARPLIEDDSVRSHSTSLLNADVGYQLNRVWKMQLDIFNLLDRESSAIDYYYTSRLSGEPLEGANDIHFHPVEPRSVRIGLVGRM